MRAKGPAGRPMRFKGPRYSVPVCLRSSTGHPSRFFRVALSESLNPRCLIQIRVRTVWSESRRQVSQSLSRPPGPGALSESIHPGPFIRLRRPVYPSLFPSFPLPLSLTHSHCLSFSLIHKSTRSRTHTRPHAPGPSPPALGPRPPLFPPAFAPGRPSFRPPAPAAGDDGLLPPPDSGLRPGPPPPPPAGFGLGAPAPAGRLSALATPRRNLSQAGALTV